MKDCLTGNAHVFKDGLCVVCGYREVSIRKGKSS